MDESRRWIIFLCRCDRSRFICDKEKYEIKRECDSTGQTGDKIGEVIYSLNGKEIGKVDILATEDVEEISYGSAMKEAVRGWTL